MSSMDHHPHIAIHQSMCIDYTMYIILTCTYTRVRICRANNYVSVYEHLCINECVEVGVLMVNRTELNLTEPLKWFNLVLVLYSQIITITYLSNQIIWNWFYSIVNWFKLFILKIIKNK